MRYLPKSPADRDRMLRALGAASIDDLFAPIPAAYRLGRDLQVPRAMAESEIVDYFRQRAAEMAAGYQSFLGAGAYNHYRPVVIDALVSRGEFFTAYTPYQAEISQGTLQSIFEFQTMICELTGMEVANASMYDGSTAVAEAVMMAERATGRSGAVVARSVHPEYREVLATYARHQGIHLEEVAFAADARVPLPALAAALQQRQPACVVLQSPNFFGAIEDVAAIAEAAHAAGALLVVAIAEAVSLGIVRPPAAPTSWPWKANPSACRLASADPTSASSPPRRNSCARCPAASLARPATARAAAAIASLSPRASSTSAARRRPATSAPTRRWWPSWPPSS